MILFLLFSRRHRHRITYAVGMSRARQEAAWILSFGPKYVSSPGEAAGESMQSEPKSAAPWDGFVRVKVDDAKAIGLLLHTVEPQVEPINLPLMGRTDYDPNTLSKIRPHFDTSRGKGPGHAWRQSQERFRLVDLFSTDLAAAKNDFQTAYVQWQHDLRLLKSREKLFAEKAIAEQVLVDSKNDESKSRLNYTTAKEKLLVFGVPEEDINPLLKNLAGDADTAGTARNQRQGQDDALSPVEGIVIQRDAVPGNLYDNDDSAHGDRALRSSLRLDQCVRSRPGAGGAQSRNGNPVSLP